MLGGQDVVRSVVGTTSCWARAPCESPGRAQHPRMLFGGNQQAFQIKSKIVRNASEHHRIAKNPAYSAHVAGWGGAGEGGNRSLTAEASTAIAKQSGICILQNKEYIVVVSGRFALCRNFSNGHGSRSPTPRAFKPSRGYLWGVF